MVVVDGGWEGVCHLLEDVVRSLPSRVSRVRKEAGRDCRTLSATHLSA